MKKMMVVLIAVLVAFVSCQPAGKSSTNLFPQDDGKVIAEFDGIKITDKYLKTYIDEMNPYLKSRYNSPEKKEELVTKIIEGEIIARKAINEGALNDPSLLSKVKSTIARHYSGTKMKEDVEKMLEVSEDDMKKHFEENKASFNQPEKIKASHILVKVDEKRTKDEAKKIADKVLKEAKAGMKDPKSFTELVKKYSDDEGSKRRGGDLGYFEKTEEGGKMVKPFSDAAFTLKEIGDMSELVETEFGFHIIKLTGKKEKVEKSFEDVKKNIENTLKTEKRKTSFEDMIAKIKSDMGYKFNKEAAAALDLEVPVDIQQSSDKLDQRQAPKQQIDPKKLEQLQKMIKKSPEAKAEQAPEGVEKQ
ncbi:MAG TPA: peptidylprolyl isomerase [bacterium]|nr:peptidylprolyl isomerase [bacterium]